jgi:hypothetical protein
VDRWLSLRRTTGNDRDAGKEAPREKEIWSLEVACMIRRMMLLRTRGGA